MTPAANTTATPAPEGGPPPVGARSADRGRSAKAAPAEWFADLLLRHFARYPEMETADAYKLLHQSAMGPAHAVGDPAAARRCLLAELAALPAVGAAADDAEPVVDPIAPDGGTVRVHLAPYAAAGLPVDRLFEAFVASARASVPRPDLLTERCAILVRLVRDGRLPFDADALERELSRLAVLGYPAARHSAGYRARYRPAYRVVAVGRLDAWEGGASDDPWWRWARRDA